MVTLNIDPFGDSEHTPADAFYQQLLDTNVALQEMQMSICRMLDTWKEYEEFALSFNQLNKDRKNNETT